MRGGPPLALHLTSSSLSPVSSSSPPIVHSVFVPFILLVFLDEASFKTHNNMTVVYVIHYFLAHLRFLPSWRIDPFYHYIVSLHTSRSFLSYEVYFI